MATAPRKTPAKTAAKAPSKPKTAPKPAGAKPAASRKLPPHEFEALCREAYEAHDFSAERVRFDSLGRKWTFLPDKEAGHSVIRLRVEQLTASAEAMISTAMLATDDRLAHIGEQLTALAKAIA